MHRFILIPTGSDFGSNRLSIECMNESLASRTLIMSDNHMLCVYYSTTNG